MFIGSTICAHIFWLCVYTGAVINAVAYYLIGIPLCLLFAFRLKLGLVGLWMAMITALGFAFIVGVWFICRLDWTLEVDKARSRIRLNTDDGLSEAPADIITGTIEDLDSLADEDIHDYRRLGGHSTPMRSAVEIGEGSLNFKSVAHSQSDTQMELIQR